MAEPYAQFQYCWTRSPKMRQLVKGGVSAPAITLMRAWEWAVAEYGSPTVDLDDLEDACDWDGEPGVLVALLQKTGHLDGDTFSLWWLDAVQPMLDARKKWADRKAKQREKRKMSHGTSPGRPVSVTGTAPGHPGDSTGTSGGLPRDVQGESLPKSRVKESRGEEITSPDSRADARKGAFAWKGEAGDLFGAAAEKVVDIIEAVADARGYGTAPDIVWQSAKPILKSAAGMHHFDFALDSFKTRMSEDHGRSMYLGNGPWSWIRTLAGNGPYSNSNQQQRKAPVPYRHQTNIDQAKKTYPPIIHLDPKDAYDVGVADW